MSNAIDRFMSRILSAVKLLLEGHYVPEINKDDQVYNTFIREEKLITAITNGQINIEYGTKLADGNLYFDRKGKYTNLSQLVNAVGTSDVMSSMGLDIEIHFIGRDKYGYRVNFDVVYKPSNDARNLRELMYFLRDTPHNKKEYYAGVLIPSPTEEGKYRLLKQRTLFQSHISDKVKVIMDEALGFRYDIMEFTERMSFFNYYEVDGELICFNIALADIPRFVKEGKTDTSNLPWLTRDEIKTQFSGVFKEFVEDMFEYLLSEKSLYSSRPEETPEKEEQCKAFFAKSKEMDEVRVKENIMTVEDFNKRWC